MSTSLFLFAFVFSVVVCDEEYFEYIIIGGGVAGISMGYYLQQLESTKNKYIILERSSIAGSFFAKYPIHDKLLSINKYRTGYYHKEFNLRHDWNSLLSPAISSECNECSASKKFKYNTNNFNFSLFSRDYYPNKQDLHRYIQQYVGEYDIKIEYSTNVLQISQDSVGHDFKIVTNTSTVYKCKYLFIATGLFEPYIPLSIEGIEHAIGYEDISKNLSFFDNKRVAIIGGGNSGFEIAQFISTVTAYTHVLLNKYPKFAYATHYVGDLRSVNLEFIDHYLLKSMDALAKLEVKIEKTENGKYKLLQKNGAYPMRPWELRDAYDLIIRATGFRFDYSIFDDEMKEKIFDKEGKYPLMNDKYEAMNVNGLYFIGTIMHRIDYKESAGAFIHGFRYLTKALFAGIVDRFNSNRIRIMNEEIAKYLLIRSNTASSIYQMFGYMADFVVITRDTSYYFYDLLVSQIDDIVNVKDGCIGIISLTFDYHKDFHGHFKVFEDPNRIHDDYRTGENSNFLHPIFKYYDCDTLNLVSERHLIEDFLIQFNLKKFHTDWLTKWIEELTNVKQELDETLLADIDALSEFYE